MVRGKYRIDAFIASGGVANVYAATHRNGSRVALKVLHKDLARDTTFAERFRREGYFGNAIVHPGIVRAIDDDMTDDGCAFLVFELLDGETLEQKREAAGGKLPLHETLDIGDVVLDILSAAHDHQILHRDLKPDNVYITRKGEVKLLDFGTARFNDGKSSSDMTSVGMVLGTVAFMAPEQAAGKREEVDARSDLWAVGAMLFTCLTGQAVHVGGDLKTKQIAIARTRARSLKETAPQIPRVVASVIDRALSFDKAERYADAKSMREALGWARRSLTGDTDEDGVTSIEPETRRKEAAAAITDPDDAPTMIGERGVAPAAGMPPPGRARTPSQIEREEEETEKRAKLPPNAMSILHRAPEIKRAPQGLHPLSEGVITSAPPVTLREKPPEMPPSEGPTFSLRNDPVFSLKEAREKSAQPIDSPDEPIPTAPRTERLPKVGSEPETPKLPPPEDPGALFRAALERQLAVNDEPVPMTSPSPRITPSGDIPSQLPRQPVPLVMPASFTPAPAYPNPLAPTGPPPPVLHDPIADIEFRTSSVNKRPGPLLETVTKPKRNPLRWLLPIFIGVAAGGGTYVLILKQKARRTHSAAATASTPAPSVSASASASASAPAPDLDASVPPVMSAALAPSASVAVTASASASAAPIKKKKPKPKPPPPQPTEDPAPASSE